MTQLSLKTICQKIGLGLSASLLLSSSVEAIENDSPTQQLSETIVENSPVLVAELRNYCDGNESVFIMAETPSFWINICGGDAPSHYVGVSKSNGSSIRRPLNNYSNNWFEAYNGDVHYQVFVNNEEYGNWLYVTQGNKELVNQTITNW